MIRRKQSSRNRVGSAAIVLASVAALSSICPSVSTGAQTQDKAIPNVTETTQMLLRALYPEIADKNYILTVETSGAIDINWTHLPPINFTVGTGEKGHKDYVGGVSGGKPARWVEMKPILAGQVDFDPGGIITYLYVRSDSVLFDSVNDRIRAKVVELAVDRRADRQSDGGGRRKIGP